MSKIAIVVLANAEGSESLGRVVNALTAAKEFKDAGDDVKVVFSGAGTRWVAQLANPNHNLHGLFVELKHQIAGVCGFCAGAFEVADSVKACGVPLLEEYGASMSYRQLLSDGYQMLTF